MSTQRCNPPPARDRAPTGAALDHAGPRTLHLPPLALSDGALEALKWLGLLLMTLDHVNKYLLQSSVPPLFAAGRLALPLFVTVLACNLARPGALARGVHLRVMRRLALAGTAATLPFTALGGLGWGWWPLNVMATLLLATGVVYLLERGGAHRLLAALLFVSGGALVEFWWPALAMAIGVWSYARRPNWPALFIGLGGLAALHPINRNAWAIAALPVVVIASTFHGRVVRLRGFFYAFYPLHLVALWLLRDWV